MKKLMKMLPVIVMVCLIITSVYAIPSNVSSALGNGTASNSITGAAQNVWATVVTIVQILSVAAIVFAGLRYMFASADQKADIKKSMGILAIGAFLVFGSTLVINLIAGATNVLK